MTAQESGPPSQARPKHRSPHLAHNDAAAHLAERVCQDVSIYLKMRKVRIRSHRVPTVHKKVALAPTAACILIDKEHHWAVDGMGGKLRRCTVTVNVIAHDNARQLFRQQVGDVATFEAWRGQAKM